MRFAYLVLGENLLDGLADLRPSRAAKGHEGVERGLSCKEERGEKRDKSQ